ncbi:hypothetical protein HY251_04485 [bacterium]|nr:hypothetical protein [bacterium]
MKTNTIVAALGTLLVAGLSIHGVRAGEPDKKLLGALSKSKHTLEDGIREAEKSHGTAISAKFEFDDKGKLSLSVYTAGRGLGTDPEHNVLQELSGSPEADKWTPEVEVWKDVEHVSRSSRQHTLMALSSQTLLDILAKAEKKQPGKALSISPVVHDRKGAFAVTIATGADSSVDLVFDLAGELQAGKR